MDIGEGCGKISIPVPGTHYTGTLQGTRIDHMVENIQEILNRINSLFY